MISYSHNLLTLHCGLKSWHTVPACSVDKVVWLGSGMMLLRFLGGVMVCFNGMYSHDLLAQCHGLKKKMPFQGKRSRRLLWLQT